jgi:hypothetical protein
MLSLSDPALLLRYSNAIIRKLLRLDTLKEEYFLFFQELSVLAEKKEDQRLQHFIFSWKGGKSRSVFP